MKILHVASFDGNIGDNASHLGFRTLLKEVIQDKKYTISQVEIRKFYNNYNLADKLRFDENFADLANKFDLLVIGGGGFLDFDIKDSLTGTTFNISNSILDKIKTPIFISSIGSNPRNTIPEGNLKKFRSFLDHFLGNQKNFLAVRNDGSRDVIKNLVGEHYYRLIPEVLDHGFFYSNDGSLYLPSEKPYVLINTTSDQVIMSGKTNDSKLYLFEMKKVIDHLLNETELNIVFAPHIYSDYQAIDTLLKNVHDFHLRTRIILTPYYPSNLGCNQIYSAYKNSALVLGMRFHANVCSIAMKVPSIGLAALDRVAALYSSLNIPKRAVSINEPFSTELIRMMNQSLSVDSWKNSELYEELDRRKAASVETYKRIIA